MRIKFAVGIAALATAAASITSFAGSAQAVTPPLLPGTYHPLAVSRIVDTAAGKGAPAQPVAAHGVLTVSVTGHGGVPSSGVGTVLLQVKAAAGTSNGALTVYTHGTTRPTTTNVFYLPTENIGQSVPVKVDFNGQVDIYNNSTGTVQLYVDVNGWYTAGAGTAAGTYASLPPAPLVDTSKGIGAPAAPLGAGSQLTVSTLGRAGLPATAVGSVALNVAVGKATAAGGLSIYAVGTHRPAWSSFDYGKNISRSQVVWAPVDANGRFLIDNISGGSVSVYADVIGYVSRGTAAYVGTYRAITPTRIISGSVAANATTGADLPATIPLPGIFLPIYPSPSAITAVLVRVSATGVGGTGGLTVYPNNITRPGVSNVSLSKNIVASNLLVLPVQNGYTGDVSVTPPHKVQINVYNGSSGAATVGADVLGFYTATGTTITTAVGSSVSGKVTDSAGNGLRGVVVSTDADLYKGGGQLVTTAADGSYFMPMIEGTSHTICFDASAVSGGIGGTYLDQCYNNKPDLESADQFTTTPGSARTINVALASANGQVTGTVTDTNGHALKGITVNVTNAGPDAVITPTTDELGGYLVSRVAPGTTITVCFDPRDTFGNSDPAHGGSFDTTGYLPACYHNSATGTPITVTSGPTTANQTLAAGGAISGVVTRTGGAECQGCSVDVRTVGSGSPDPANGPDIAAGVVEYGNGGTYTVRGIKPGTYQVWFDGGGAPVAYPTTVTVTTAHVSTGVNAVLS